MSGYRTIGPTLVLDLSVFFGTIINLGSILEDLFFFDELHAWFVLFSSTTFIDCVAPFTANLSASSLPGMPLCAGTWFHFIAILLLLVNSNSSSHSC